MNTRQEEGKKKARKEAKKRQKEEDKKETRRRQGEGKKCSANRTGVAQWVETK